MAPDDDLPLWLAALAALAAALVGMQGIWARSRMGISFGRFLWYVLAVSRTPHVFRAGDPRDPLTFGHPDVRQARRLFCVWCFGMLLLSLLAPQLFPHLVSP